MLRGTLGSSLTCELFTARNELRYTFASTLSRLDVVF